jgi:magnesium transporter
VSTLVERDGGIVEAVERDAIRERLDAGEFFWLDLVDPTADDYATLREVFEFHPLAVEDSEKFGQRAKLEDYGEFAFFVVFGWSPDEDGLVEVHCFYSDRYLVTVRQDDSPALDALFRRYAQGASLEAPIRALYRVLDALVDSFFPALADFDERLDEIQLALLAEGAEPELQELTTMRHRLITLRRVVGPQRDMLGRLAAGVSVLPGLDRDAERFFRDVYDHLIRLGETIDGYRDVASTVMDVYLSSASNRTNRVIQRLTLIATVFLPLTFVTGYFGQNFGWLVESADDFWTFFVLGIVAQLLVVALLLVWFRRRRWI